MNSYGFRSKFMTQASSVPTIHSRAHVHASASLLSLLLLIASGCKTDETRHAPAKDADPPEVEDAGMQCPAFNADYRNDFKACNADADCEIASLEYGCRERHGVFGVASSEREAFDECAPKSDDLPACQGRVLPARAEDNRVLAPDRQNVEARCYMHQCQSRLTERPCGGPDKICSRSQLCMSFQDAMGLPAYLCVDNPCGNGPLNCDCADPVCVSAGDGIYTCAVDQVEDSDVYCKRQQR